MKAAPDSADRAAAQRDQPNTLRARESDLRILFKTLPDTAQGGCHARIWLPKTSLEGGIKVAIMYHGGAFTFGEDSDVPGPEVDYLNAHGVVVVSLQYRLAPHVRFKELEEDLTDGYQWVLQSLPQSLGVERVKSCCVSGWSAGATSTCLAVAGAARRGLPRPNAIMCTYGLFDTNTNNIVTAGFPVVPQGDHLEDTLAQPCETGIAHTPPTHPSSARRWWLLKQFSEGTLNHYLNDTPPAQLLPPTYMPYALVNRAWPPTYILIATEDQLIDPRQSYDFIATLKSASVDVESGEADMPHGASEVEWTGTEQAREDYKRWWEAAIRAGLDFMIKRLNQ